MLVNKSGVCITIVQIWFGITNEKIKSVFGWVICPPHVGTSVSVFSYLDDNFIKCQMIFTKCGVCIDIMEIKAQLFKANDVVS